MANNCPRCRGSMSSTEPHDFGKCPKNIITLLNANNDKIQGYWPDVNHLGAKNDDAGDVQRSDYLLQNFQTMSVHDGKPVTKWMLENAFRKVFSGKGKNLAQIERENAARKATSGPTKPTPSSSSRLQSSKGGFASRSLQDPKAFRTDIGRTLSDNPVTGKFHLTEPPPLPPKTYAAKYKFAVHQACALDDSLAGAPKPQTLKVATNYVAVTQTPLKLHRYSIEFGTITLVKTKKQNQDDEDTFTKLSYETDGAAPTLAKATETLSITKSRTARTHFGNDSAHEDHPEDNEDHGYSGGHENESEGRKIAQRSEKARIFRALRDISPLDRVVSATDYDTLWTLSKLPTDDSDTATVANIQYSKLSGRKYQLNYITFKYQGDLDIAKDRTLASRSLIIQDDVTERGSSMRITALNALISQYVSNNSDIVSVGPNKFFLKGGYDDTAAILNIHRGYFTSIRPGAQSILLNVNVATSAFYQPIAVSELFHLIHTQFKGYGKPEDLLKGLTVRIAYDREKHDDEYDPNDEDNRKRTIAGFGEKPSSQTFEVDDATATVAAYFKTVLGAPTLQYPDLPCLSVNVAPKKEESAQNNDKDDFKQPKGKGKAKAPTKTEQKKVQPIWIPPEYLQIVPYQAFSKLLLSEHTDKMMSVALRHPAENQNLIITEGFSLFGIGAGRSLLQKLGIEVEGKLLQIPARRLPAPRVFYRNLNDAGYRLAAVNDEASWNLRGVRFYTTPQPDHPALRSAVCTLDMRDMKRNSLLEGLTHLGLDLSAAMQDYGIPFASNIAKTHEYFDAIEAMDKAMEAMNIVKNDGTPDREGWNDVTLHDVLVNRWPKINSSSKMFIVLLSRKEQGLYGMIKRVCDQWLGVHTVCFVENKSKLLNDHGGFKDVDSQQLGNLALKFNMKLGGQNHQLSLPSAGKTPSTVFGKISRDTIVFGADVSHPSGGMPNTPSVAAVVASDDTDFAHFSASMRLQASTQEMIEDLEGMVYYRLMHFIKVRGFIPRRIIFYRDGIGEDQFAKCRTMEIRQIRSAYSRASANAPGVMDQTKQALDASSLSQTLELSFIVTGKRHHTRFFPCDENDTYQTNRGQETKVFMRGRDGKAVKLNGNLKPGLIVDQVITRPGVDETFDFFLQSHGALKGTARSAHYSVLEQGDLSVNDIQTYTHAFCYNSMRATKGVSYAGPAYYADRLCDRGAHYLRCYTMNTGIPRIDMDDRESNMEKREGAKALASRVAAHISKCQEWQPWDEENIEEDREQNPWHPDFDNCMFWL